MEEDTDDLHHSKNVSYLDCLWGELYGSINNGFLRIFAK